MYTPDQSKRISEDETEEEGNAGEGEGLLDEHALSLSQEITECFSLFDKTKSGVFEIKYLDKALKCLGIFLSSVELEEVTENFDKNGLVYYDQFRNFALEKALEIDPMESLTAAFEVFDPDNERMLPTDRFKRWMMTLGEPLSEKEAKDLVKLGDPTDKGFVAYDPLIAYLLAS